MIFLIDNTNEEPRLIGPFKDSTAATHWGAANIEGHAWGWYEAEEPG